MAHFPDLPKSIRQRALLLSMAIDQLAPICTLLLGLFISVLVLSLYLATIAPVYPLGQGLVLLLDIATIVYLDWHSVKICFFGGHFFSVLLYVLTSQQMFAVRRLDYLLQKVVFKFNQNKKSLSKRHYRRLTTFIISTFLPLYQRIVVDLRKTDNELVSSGLLLALLTLLGFNVYSTSMAMLKTLSTEVLLILGSLNGVIIIFFTVALGTMISVKRRMRAARYCLHSRALPVLATRHCCSSADVRLRLKVMSFSRVKFAFTVGPIGVLTAETAFQALFIYAAYLLFSISFLLKT